VPQVAHVILSRSVSRASGEDSTSGPRAAPSEPRRPSREEQSVTHQVGRPAGTPSTPRRTTRADVV